MWGRAPSPVEPCEARQFTADDRTLARQFLMSGGPRKTLTTGGTEVAQGITGEICVGRVLESGLFAAFFVGRRLVHDQRHDVAMCRASKLGGGGGDLGCSQSCCGDHRNRGQSRSRRR
jgi:hypothetical protein